MGVTHVESFNDQSKIKARADILTEKVLNLLLTVVPERSNHPCHANLQNWPDEDGKPEMIALEIAESAKLHMRP